MSRPNSIGLAGWSEAVSRYRSAFPADGSALTRYAGTFDFVEVNVTFYRAVREATFASWAEQTPADFRFSVKLNRSVTHAARLSGNARLEEALQPMGALGHKLAALRVTPVLTEIPHPNTPHAPGGDYVRLHGTPRRYRSSCPTDQLRALAAWITESTSPAYVVFYNTAGPTGVANGRELQELLGS